MASESMRIFAERTHLAFAASAVGASLVLDSPRFAASVLAGAAVETVNFRAICRQSEVVLGLADPKESSKLAVFGFGARFALVAIAIGVALYFDAHAVGLVLGLSLIVPAIVIAAWRHREPSPVAPTALDPDDPEWDVWNPWLARERDLDSEEEED